MCLLVLLTPLAALHAADNSAAPPVQNASMTAGKDKPDGWTNQWVGSGKIAVSRDTATYHSEPASLQIVSVDGPANAQVQQFFDGKPGDVVQLVGHIRADGGATAMLGIMAYDKDWKGIDFQPAGNALSGFDWRKVQRQVTLPEKTAHAAIVCMIQGDGHVWLDDVSLDGEDRGANAKPKAVAVPAKPKAAGPRKPSDSCDPAEGFWPDYPDAWRQVVDGQLKRAKEGPAPLVFIGDSLTQGWSEQPRWKEHYARLGAVNLGVGGDGTPQVLWRIDKGILDGLNPRVVVLCIGINNVWPGFGAEDTVKGIVAILARLEEKCPQAKVLLLGNTHFFDRGDGKSRQRVLAINAASRETRGQPAVRFLDFSEQMLSEDDGLKLELYASDKLHFSARGYELWARPWNRCWRTCSPVQSQPPTGNRSTGIGLAPTSPCWTSRVFWTRPPAKVAPCACKTGTSSNPTAHVCACGA